MSRDASEMKVVPVRHPGRWVASAVVLVLVAMLVHSLFFSTTVRSGQRQPRFQWHIIDSYFFTATVLRGLEVTIEITAIAMAGGIALGVLLAIMRLSPNPIVSGSAWVYVWFFRGTPLLVQLIFWYYAAYLFPSFSIGLPFGPALFHINLNTTLTPFVAASFGFAINEGAYMAEIVRAGILSVDEGQTEAAQSIGMSRLMTLRLIVLPQAMRVIIPPTGNETISMLKNSALASVVTLGELLFNVQEIYATNYKTIPLLMVASLWYLIVTSVLMVGQFYLERHYARGSARQRPPTFWSRLARNLRIRPKSQNASFLAAGRAHA
ncbi:MAG TPA: amino acid ABC transporter permease [Acidimicrobiales bacterium]|jgi:polar amino acid transport system permease protein|nr:amino acid ABC transporter permease [Acidimicrobiales bacterium]